MNKGQLSFAFAGLLFGFLIGFVVAHQIWAGRGAGFTHPPIPPGMEGAAGMPPVDRPAGGTRPQPGSGEMGEAPAASSAAGAAGMGMMEQVQKEITSLKALVEKEPQNAAALTRLGDMYFDVGKFDGAKEYYTRALAAKPGDINVETDLGTVLKNLGEPAEALKHFETSVAADPRHWKGWFNIGIVCMYDLGDFDRAEKAFEKVAELNPGAIRMDALKEEMAKEKAKRVPGGGGS